MVTTVAGYYDTWRDRQLDDKRRRNGRVVAALHLARQMLTPGRLLDVGCGIGWTSSELAGMGHTVTGLDISPVLIETADLMFGDQCEFVCADFTQDFFVSDGFDNITMIDVYEHFSVNTRSRVHMELAMLLRPKGRLLLTAPTPELQQAAREQGLEMQPVDEDVTEDDLERLAADIDGRIIWRRRQWLSSCGDYWHVLIERRKKSKVRG